MAQLQTVNGLIDPGKIQTGNAHDHLWIDPPADAEVRIELNDAPMIENELASFGSDAWLVVDCQPGRCGRNANRLMQFSTLSGIHITCTTGFHLQKYYSPDDWLWSADEAEAAAYFMTELTEQLFEVDYPLVATTVKVGYMGDFVGRTRVLMEAAAEVARETGVVVLFHTEAGHNAEALLPFFADRGVPPTQLYLCHMDKRPDLALHSELAQAGVLLGYDTFVRAQYEPEKHLWPLIKQMVAAGHAGQVALGLDLAYPRFWRSQGGPGIQYFEDGVIPRLRQEGIPDAAIRQLTGANIAHFLARR